jgi:23S rRNA pseudouridine2605 synthase
LRGGLTVDGVHYGEIEATLDRLQGSNIWLTFAIREGKNREVRNVLGHFGLTVTRLIRTSFGPFQLGEIAEGAVEEVPSRVLREQLGERLVAQSGADFAAPITPITPPAEPPARDMRRRPPVPGKRPAKEERPKRGPKSPSPAHSWRAPAQDEPGKKLRREFRGSRREVEKPHEQSAQKSRTGLLTDRKGRRVLVERVAQPARERAENAPSKAAFKRTFKDRPKGPFKERPKGPFKERPKGAFKERHKGSQTDARRGRRGAPDRSSGARPHRPRER